MNNRLSSQPVYFPDSISCLILDEESSMSFRWIFPRK